MRRPLALALLLAACSSAPPPADVPRMDGCPVDRDGACAVPPPDVQPDAPPPVDVGFDGGPDVVDAFVATDPAPIVDQGVDVPPEDAGADVFAVGDAGPADAGMDAGPADVGTDAVAVPELPSVDAGPEDVAADRPDVVDVPRDAGPVDGGPVVYDLEVARSGVEYVGLYRRTSASGATLDCTAVPTRTSCSVTAGRLRFDFDQCGVTFVGTFTVPPGTADRLLSVGIGGAAHFAPSPTIRAGARIAGSPARRSFHVQYARTVNGPAPGAAGIPGLTVDPVLGDIWILGCPSD